MKINTKKSIQYLITSGFLIFAVVFVNLEPVFANHTTLHEIQYYQQKLNEARSRKSSYQNDVYRLGLEINSALAELKHTEGEIGKARAAISKLNKKIKAADAELNRKKELLKSVIQEIDRYNSYSLVEVMVKAPKFNDFLDEVGDVFVIQKFLSSELADIKALKEELEGYRSLMQAKSIYLSDLKKKQSEKRNDLQVSQGQKQYLVSHYAGRAAAYSKKIAQLYAQLRTQSRSICSLASNSNNWNYNKKVSKGQTIGYRGNSGFSSGPHLHFEIANSSCNNVNPNTLINSGAFMKPVSGTISCGYHYPPYGYCGQHNGLDIAGPKGTSVKAGAAGTVIYRRFYSPNANTWPRGPATYGMFVVMKHRVSGKTYYSLYAHLNGIAV